MKCPNCEKEVPEVRRIYTTQKTFCSKNPLEGLLAYGPYSLPKELLCEKRVKGRKFVHIRFPDGEERLIIHM